MSILVRRATPADAATIHRFICALAEYERQPDAVEVTPQTLAAQLASPVPPFECLLAEKSAVPAGFALFFTSYSTWKGRPGLFLEDLFVMPEQRRFGVGKLLLLEVVRLARERNYGRVEWNVLRWNEPALAFYRSLGAEALDEWIMYRLSGASLCNLE